jgi:hypothetical protein
VPVAGQSEVDRYCAIARQVAERYRPAPARPGFHWVLRVWTETSEDRPVACATWVEEPVH